jgi:hypothetical protein
MLYYYYMKKDKCIYILLLIILLSLFGYLLFERVENKKVQNELVVSEEFLVEDEILYPDYSMLMNCDGGKEFTLDYTTVSNSPGPTEIPVPIDTTLADIKTDTGEEFYLRLEGDNLSEGYTFSNSKFLGEDKLAVLKIKDNVAELFLGTNDKYENCTNKEIESMRLEIM